MASQGDEKGKKDVDVLKLFNALIKYAYFDEKTQTVRLPFDEDLHLLLSKMGAEEVVSSGDHMTMSMKYYTALVDAMSKTLEGCSQ